jgi:spore coat polysaccharide biosynthesis protein SpsF (cytidylyltransferase family)
MSTLAVMSADLQRSALGTASRLAEPLAGEPIIARTVRRVLAASSVDRLIIAAPAAQCGMIRELIAGTPAAVTPFDGPPSPAAAVVRAARKWSLHSWRGGLGGTCFFDEHTHPALCAALADQHGADHVLSVPAGAPLLDPQALDGLVAHFRRQPGASAGLAFAQAPPGTAGAVFSVALLREAARAGIAPGWFNAYKPGRPRSDLTTTSCCFPLPLEVQHTAGRMTPDTRRSFERLQHLLDGGEPQTLVETCSRWRELCARLPEPLPREIEIELTTEDQLARTKLRPRGAALQRRGVLDLACLRRLAEQAGACDDVRAVLGGFGEPLLHAEFTEALAACRAAGLLGLAVRTNGLALNDGASRALIENDVDVVQVLIDAVDAAGYRERHGHDGFERVLQNVDGLAAQRAAAGKSVPIIVPTLTKTRETLGDLDAFFDRWVSTHGWAVIEGASHHAGLVEDRRVMSMAPPRRGPCRQLGQRLTVLSDGRALACDQDFRGLYGLGNVHEHTLADIWRGARLRSLCQAHAEGRYDGHPMCPACDEWHRP